MARGLSVVGLTQVSRSATDEKVKAFISTHELTFPIGKENDSSISRHVGVHGVPAAAVVKNGKIVWRGHPARVNNTLLDRWL